MTAETPFTVGSTTFGPDSLPQGPDGFQPHTCVLDSPVLDLSTILHILRNPSGWSEHLLRAARLQGADLIERLQRDLAQSEMTLTAMETNR